MRLWQDQELSIATVKYRIPAQRWWQGHIRNASTVAKSNDHYRIDELTYVAAESKATELAAARVRTAPRGSD
ncbi:MAG: hypothetical protein F4W90_07425 [Gammaproteobacteria bacterium]|nr:hypothetical protein [Gammaproteobacteria bacterium]